MSVGQDRPNLQFAVRGLASKMLGPTHQSWQQLIHLVQYMSRTEEYHLVSWKTPRGISNLHQSIGTVHLILTVLAQLLRSRNIYLKSLVTAIAQKTKALGNQHRQELCFSMDRSYIHFQGTRKVAFFSGEAEYYAGASAASDSILLKEATVLDRKKSGETCIWRNHLEARCRKSEAFAD